jgi:hypothetical protein
MGGSYGTEFFVDKVFDETAKPSDLFFPWVGHFL